MGQGFRGQPRPGHIPWGGAPVPSVLGVLLYLRLHHSMQIDHVRQGNTWGRGVVLGVSHMPPIPSRRVQALPNFGVYPSIYVYTLWRRMTKFYMVRECLFLESATPRLKGKEHQRSQFWGFSHTCAFTVWPRATKFGVVYTWRDACLGVSYASCILRNVSRGLSAIDEFLVKSIMLIVTEKSGHRIRIV